MATSTSFAMTCNLCENPAVRFCNHCQVELCVDCVSRHVDEIDSLSHDIAPFEDKKVHLVLSECETHSGRRCEAYCRQCQIPVCSKCLIDSHKDHDALDIVPFVENKKQEIKKETEKMEEKLKFYQKKCAKISKYVKVKENLKSLRKTWHKEVNAIFDKLSLQFSSNKECDLETLTTNHTCIQNLIPDLIQTIKNNNEILLSAKASEVTKYPLSQRQTKEIQGNFDFEVTIPSLFAKTLQGTQLYIEMGETSATLTRTPYIAEVRPLCLNELLSKARLFATIKTNHNPLCRVECIGTKEAWIAFGQNIIKKCSIHNEVFVQNSLNILCKYVPEDISVTRRGELIYSENKTVNIVKHGMSKTLITTPDGWNVRGLCCTRPGDILVSVINTKENKVIRYEGQEITQEIYKDEHGNQIFENGQYMLFLTENNNGDICVSDGNADRVVVVDRAGRVRFRYDGMPAFRKDSFDPRCIVIDSLSQIIVSDMNNDCLHILDQNGKFLGCVDDCELNRPLGLSLDTEGRLWVGSFRTGEIKVLKYLK